MAKLGNVKLSIDSENLSTSVDITSYPVEKGAPMSDHVREKPQTLTVSGVVIGKDYKTQLQKLRDDMRKAKVLTYTGRTIAKNVLIKDIDDNRKTKIKNGSSVSIQLQFVRIAKSPWKKVQNKGKKQKVVKKKSTAVYHKVKRGDTYWGCARKYGTTVSALRKLNPWPDRRIPIGVKMRIR